MSGLGTYTVLCNSATIGAWIVAWPAPSLIAISSAIAIVIITIVIVTIVIVTIVNVTIVIISIVAIFMGIKSHNLRISVRINKPIDFPRKRALTEVFPCV